MVGVAFFTTLLLSFNGVIGVSAWLELYQIKGSVIFELFTHSLCLPLARHRSQVAS